MRFALPLRGGSQSFAARSPWALRGQTQPFGWLYRFAPFGKTKDKNRYLRCAEKTGFFVLKNASRTNPTSVPPVGFIRFAQLPGGFPSLRFGKSPSYVVLASLRTKVKTVCFVSFIARSARLKSGARFARTKVKTFVFCEACSRERSHKDPRG
jgi:hypothetical protein